jgi:hypothetical protein
LVYHCLADDFVIGAMGLFVVCRTTLLQDILRFIPAPLDYPNRITEICLKIPIHVATSAFSFHFSAVCYWCR